MSVVVITAPTQAGVDTEVAMRHLRIDDEAEADEVARFVAVATASIDGPGKWLGRAIRPQVLELRLSSFCDRIPLPCPPFIQVVGVKFDNADGADQTLDPSNYRVIGGDRPCLIRSRTGAWPSVYGDEECIRVQYRCGYEGEALPEDISNAILLLAGHFYENREAVVFPTGNNPSELPLGVQRLLMNYEVLAW